MRTVFPAYIYIYIYITPPKSPNDNSSYKSKIKLDLEKLKNGQFQHVKVDLTKMNINTLAKQIGVLSEDARLYMYLLTSKRDYALNDRTINLLMEGGIDVCATATGKSEGVKESGSEVIDLINVEKEVEFFIVDTNRTSRWILLSIS